MRGFRDLSAWQKAMELVTEVYRVTRSFPKDEMYGLTSQVRRASVSVPSNIAEGYGRNSRNELHHFLGQAQGSLAEVETQIEIAKNLGYVVPECASELQSKVAELARMVTGLRSWSAKPSKQT